jgi:hypothetical protein
VGPWQRGCGQQAHSGGLQDGAVMLSDEEGEVHPQPRCWRCFDFWRCCIWVASAAYWCVKGRCQRSVLPLCTARAYTCRWLICAAAARRWLCAHASCIVSEPAHLCMRVVL